MLCVLGIAESAGIRLAKPTIDIRKDDVTLSYLSEEFFPLYVELTNMHKL